MIPRRTIPRRRRIFVGAEGESERSLARWLSLLCDEAGLHLHLDVRVCGGGDSFEVVKYSVQEYRRRSRDYGTYSNGFVLLDADRIEQDRKHGRHPKTALDGENLLLMYLQPNIEGLLYRLHRRCERRFVSANNANGALQRVWPEYVKPTSAAALHRHFTLSDLERASRYDNYLQDALQQLGLMTR